VCLSVCLSVCPVLSVTLVYCGQTVGRIKMKLVMQVGLGPGHIVLDGDPAPTPPKGGGDPQFSAHICCGQMARRIKIPLGMEEGLGPGNFVLDGDPDRLPQKRGGAPSPIFGPCPLWPNGWMDQDGTWHRGVPWSRLHCARLGPSSRPQKGGGAPPPNFSAHFHCGQTAGCIKMPLGIWR